MNSKTDNYLCFSESQKAKHSGSIGIIKEVLEDKSLVLECVGGELYPKKMPTVEYGRFAMTLFNDVMDTDMYIEDSYMTEMIIHSNYFAVRNTIERIVKSGLFEIKEADVKDGLTKSTDLDGLIGNLMEIGGEYGGE